MTPDEKDLIHQAFDEKLDRAVSKSEALLSKLNPNREKLKQVAGLQELKETLDDAIDLLQEVLIRLKAMQKNLKDEALEGDYMTVRQEIRNLIEDYSLYYSGAADDNDSVKEALENAQTVLQPPAIFPPIPQIDLSSIDLKNVLVNLNTYPVNCADYESNKGLAPKLGDAHACVPKILYFALKAGLAQLTPDQNDSPQILYQSLVEKCQEFANLEELKKCDKNSLAHSHSLLKSKFQQVHFYQGAVMLLMGDLFMDRNGNDINTALFLKRIKESGARAFICISNHDARFLFWLLNGMHDMLVMQECGQSSPAFKFLVECGITSIAELMVILNDCYFNRLVAFYYETGPDNKVTNIASHAPTGEWEIYEIAQGVREYASISRYDDLFTDDQKLRLWALSSLPYDPKTGLSSQNLRMIMDLLNEIIHTNAIKPNKDCLNQLLCMGSERLTPEQSNGKGIPPRVAPFYRALWSRDSPRPAPPEGEKRLFLNGHDQSDAFSSVHADWAHQNVSFDDYSGKGLGGMDGQVMRFALPVPGYNPMPEIVLPPAATAAPLTHARDSDRGRADTPMPSRERDRSPPPTRNNSGGNK